jgi:hypothetical protein
MCKSTLPRGWSVVIVAALLALTACTPSVDAARSLTPHPVVSPAVATPAATLAAPTPVATPDWSRLLSADLTSDDPAAANRGMQEATGWARDESGLRAALGAEADAIFRLVDAAQTTLVQELLRQLESDDRPPGPATLFPPRLSPPSVPGQGVSYLGIADVFMSAIQEVKWRPNSQAEPRITTEEVDKELAEGITGHAEMNTTLTGSHVEANVKITLRVEKDGKAYEEIATGTLSGNICPDEQGRVPLDLSLEINGRLSDGVGFTMAFAVQAVGYVDDEANLVTVEEEIHAEMAVTRPNIWPFGGVTTEQAQLDLRNVASGLVFDKDATRKVSGPDVRSNLEAAVAKSVAVLAIVTVELVYDTARREWRSGCCVEVLVPENYLVVGTGSATPFTASVRHRFEGSDLPDPVTATMDANLGAGSVTPADTPVPAPATFTYLAPDETGQARVWLVSKSRRGIGKTKVHFEIRQTFYAVDTAIGLEFKVPLTGLIHDFEEPFTLDSVGTNPSGGKYEGTIEFTPTDADGGTWTHTATSCVGLVGCGEVTANGTYQVEGLSAGTPILKMPATTIKSDIKGYVAVYDWPAWEIVPKPTTR